MANVCQTFIKGWMPYDITSRSEKCCMQLGMLNTPCTGLKIEYGAERYVPTERGGLYAHYQFVIRGNEAVWYSVLKEMIGDFVGGGCFIEEARMMDLEFDRDNMHWEEIEIKGGKKTLPSQVLRSWHP